MGLLTSVNNLNYTLQEKEKERKRKELERIKKESERRHKEEEKENMNYIKSKISNFLRIKFQEKLYLNSSIIYEFYNINKKESLFNEFYNNLAMKENIKMDYKPFILDFFNSNYYKILKQVEAEAKKNEQYIYYNAILTQNTEKEEQQQQQEQVQYTQAKKQYNYNTIYTILKIIFYIICAPIAILVLILISACKNQK